MNPSNFIDLTGKQYERWHVVRRDTNTPYGGPRWYCRCVCGTERTVLGQTLRSGFSKSCGCYKTDRSKIRIGSQNPLWRGGRSINGHGYVLLRHVDYFGKHRPHIYEHTYVMAQHLGRPLHTTETVHHKNGQRADNRIDNLELHASAHGLGQTIPELVSFSLETLRRYAPEHLI